MVFTSLVLLSTTVATAQPCYTMVPEIYFEIMVFTSLVTSYTTIAADEPL